MTGTRKEVAEAVIALTYIEMMAMSQSLVDSYQSRKEDKIPTDMGNPHDIADLIRWWAENYIEVDEEDDG